MLLSVAALAARVAACSVAPALPPCGQCCYDAHFRARRHHSCCSAVLCQFRGPERFGRHVCVVLPCVHIAELHGALPLPVADHGEWHVQVPRALVRGVHGVADRASVVAVHWRWMLLRVVQLAGRKRGGTVMVSGTVLPDMMLQRSCMRWPIPVERDGDVSFIGIPVEGA